MIVSKEIDLTNTPPLTEEQRKMLEALKDRPITFDEDCPEQTEEDLKQFKRIDPKTRHAPR